MAKISNDQFKILNGTAPVYPGKANYWVIVMRNPALAKSRNLEDATKSVRAWWSNYMSLAAPELRADVVLDPKGLPAKRTSHVQPWPIDFGSDYVYVGITWDAPESSPNEVEWPWSFATTWDSPFTGLIATIKPENVVHVPDTIDNVIWTLDQTASDIADDASKLGSGVMAIAGAALVIALVSLTRRNG
jgi:hypothetical protein